MESRRRCLCFSAAMVIFTRFPSTPLVSRILDVQQEFSVGFFSRFRSLSTHDWKIDPFMYWIWRLETIFVFAVTREHSLTDITNGEKSDSQ
jgi:hypothetical protein